MKKKFDIVNEKKSQRLLSISFFVKQNVGIGDLAYITGCGTVYAVVVEVVPLDIVAAQHLPSLIATPRQHSDRRPCFPGG